MAKKIISLLLVFISVATLVVSPLRADDRIVMSIDDNNYTVDDFLYLYLKNRNNGGETINTHDYATMFAVFRMKVMEAEAAGIDTTQSFKSELEYYCASLDDNDIKLRQEYRDGMLLFEISDRRVWRQSTDDSDSLEELFNIQRDKYKWTEPRAKGWIIYATTPDKLTLANEYLTSHNVEYDVADTLRENFGRDITASPFLVKEGVNPIVDSIVFNSGKGFEPDNKWKAIGGYRCRIILNPEVWTDVKGDVTSDYQDILNQEWENELWNKHKVVFFFDIIDEIDN